MGLAWQLPSGVILFFLSITLGSEDTVYMAYSTNLVSLTDNGNHTFRYRIPVSQAVERNFFRQVDGLDCDRSKKMLCWTDLQYSVVRCSNPSSDFLFTDQMRHFRVNNIVFKRSGQPKDVALDPCHMLLYWTDPVWSAIGVARIERNNLDHIIPVTSAQILTAEDDLVKPTSIAADSCSGYIFFTDVGKDAEKVARAWTNGSSIKTLATMSPSSQPLQYPTALALDRPNKIIFFADTKLGEIYKMNYDGDNYETVSRATTIYDMALGCSQERIMYSSLKTLHPKYDLIDGPGNYTLRLPLIGPHLYRGACSYCEKCLCDTRCSFMNGGCSHLCFETPGGIVCGCPDGWILDPSNYRNCYVATPQLLVAYISSILSMKPNSKGGIDGTPTELSLGYVSSVYGLDYVEDSRRPYVVLADGNSLKRLNFDGSGGVTIVNSLSGVRGVAADCITKNIYYCQMTKGVISVTNLQGTAQFDCHSNIGRPFDIVLNTKKGTLFYTRIGSTSIYTASMDCKGYSTRVVEGRRVPAGLAFDGNNQVLYWTDFIYGSIESYHLSTEQHITIAMADFEHLHRPVGLTLLGNYLYFTDWGSGCVGSVDSVSTPPSTVAGVHCISGSRMHGITHVAKQCHDPDNGGDCSKCSNSQMCLLSSENGGSVKCHCPPGFISTRGHCRLPATNFILVSARHAIVALSLGGVNDWIAQLPLPPQENVIALDFDYDKKIVFWTDTVALKIMSAKLDGTEIRTLLVHDSKRDVCRLGRPDGLAYDRVQERLFYTDEASGEICFIELAVLPGTGLPKRFLGGLDKPRAIVIKDGTDRKLYFSEWGKYPRISCVDIKIPAPLPEVVIDDNLTWPNALALSGDGDRLYFGDASEDYIAYYSFDRKNVIYLSNATHVYDMDEYIDSDGVKHLVWSDWIDGVTKMSLATSSTVTLASSNDVHWASGIKVFSRDRSNVFDSWQWVH
jgi:low density lipoprotein receptor-related protein 5/6